MFSFRTVVSAVAAAGLLLSGLLAYTNHKYAGELSAARQEVQYHVKAAMRAEGHAARAELAAEEMKAEAAAADQRAQVHATRAKQLAAQLAVTKATTHDSLVNVTEQAQSWKNAYEEQIKATASLTHAVDTTQSALKDVREASTALRGSATKLVAASHRSFWSRLVPDVGVGAAAGINPQGKPDVVAGVTLSWPL